MNHPGDSRLDEPLYKSRTLLPVSTPTYLHLSRSMKSITSASSCVILLLTASFPQAAEDSLQLRGEIQPITETDVKPAIAGRIRKLHVGLGEKVKAGDLLAEIDDADTLSTVKVRAPGAGTVLRLPVIEGQFVLTPSELDAGTTLTTIADLSKVIVEAHVEPKQAARLPLQTSLQVTTVPFSKEKMEATVSFIAPIATVKGSIKGFTVQAIIDKPQPQLQPGTVVQLNVPAALHSK